MKKLIGLLLAMILVLTACTSTGTNGQKEGDQQLADGKERFKIGILQYVEHPALDEARTSFVDKLNELGIDAEIDYKNAQNDIPNTQLMAEQFVADKVDLIYAIATPAAQAAAGATEDIPVLFSAVTDPVDAKLVESNEKPGGNVTGTSDAADLDGQLSMFKQIDPSIETIGMIYTDKEENSIVQVKQVEEIAGDYGLKTVVKTINQLSDIPQIAQAIMAEVDAMYILTDNQIASSVSILSDILKENKMVSVSAEETQVAGGLLISNSLSYKKLGEQTALMAKKILADEISPRDIPVETAKDVSIKINRKTLEALDLDPDLDIFKGAEEVE